MNNFKFKKLAGSLLAVGLFAAYSGTASASPTCPENLDPAADYKCFFFNTGTDFSGNGSTTTSSFYEMGFNSTLATSIYEAGVAGGSTVIDSNIKEVLNYYGLVAGPTNYTSVGGTTVSLKDQPLNPIERDIDAFSGPLPIDENAFNPTKQMVAGSVFGWGLTFDYYLEGTVCNTPGCNAVFFNSGYFDYFFEDWTTGDTEQVARVVITGSDLNLANLDLFGYVSFDWTGGAVDKYGLDTPDGINDCTSVLCQNFWNFQTSTPSSFYALEGQGLTIQYKLDTNINPPLPSPNQLVEFTGDDENKYWIRQTTLDGSVRFNVPEPDLIALMGLGFAGLGFSARRRLKA